MTGKYEIKNRNLGTLFNLCIEIPMTDIIEKYIADSVDMNIVANGIKKAGKVSKSCIYSKKNEIHILSSITIIILNLFREILSQNREKMKLPSSIYDSIFVMVKIFFGEERRKELEKIPQDRKVFDAAVEEELRAFMVEINSLSLFGSKPILLKRGEKAKDLSFLSKVNKEVYVEIEDLDFKKFPKSDNVILVECSKNRNERIRSIQEKLKASYADAHRIEMIASDQDIEKLDNFFFNIPFVFEKAEELIIGKKQADMFKSIEALLAKNKALAISLAIVEAMPYIYSLILSIKIMIKIKICNLKLQSYDAFKKTYAEHKEFFKYHEYFVFKHLKNSTLYSLEELSEKLEKALLMEEKIKSGIIPEGEAVNILIATF